MKLFSADVTEACREIVGSLFKGKSKGEVVNTKEPSIADPKLQVEQLKDVMNGNHIMRCCAKADCTFK